MIVDLSSRHPVFHVVFTLPPQSQPFALQNKDVVYNILFRAVGETLRTIAADSKHWAAQIGFFSVLHTWGQARSPPSPSALRSSRWEAFPLTGTRWISCRRSSSAHSCIMLLFRSTVPQLFEQAFDPESCSSFPPLEPLRTRDTPSCAPSPHQKK